MNIRLPSFVFVQCAAAAQAIRAATGAPASRVRPVRVQQRKLQAGPCCPNPYQPIYSHQRTLKTGLPLPLQPTPTQVRIDLADLSQVALAAEALLQTLGALHVLINNAGVATQFPQVTLGYLLPPVHVGANPSFTPPVELHSLHGMNFQFDFSDVLFHPFRCPSCYISVLFYFRHSASTASTLPSRWSASAVE